MLNGGMWQERRIVSEAWVTQSTRPSQNLNTRYGLLWWLYERPEGFAALGYPDTNLYVFPKQDLIIVRMQSKPSNQRASYEPEVLQLFGQMVRP
jgi:CubicO group peptidase (beta-lactamase class C family)